MNNHIDNNIFLIIEDIIRTAAISAFNKKNNEEAKILNLITDIQFIVEFPKDSNHGDLSTNIAMLLASKLTNKNSSQDQSAKALRKINPREIAQKIVDELYVVNPSSRSQQNDYVIQAEVAGPGFINIKLDNSFWQNFLEGSNKLGMEYGSLNLGKAQKINVEFVSANPTGPLHIGHTRGAVYGDTLVNILKKVGYNVEKEYLINDAGKQVEILAFSLWLRYQQVCGAEVSLQPGCYPGTYLINIAQKLKELQGERLLQHQYEDISEFLKDFAIAEIMSTIKHDLAELGVEFDLFVSEQRDIINQGKVEKVLEYLKSKNLVYQGLLDKPKGKASEDWEPREQLLFRSTAFGDESDRALTKSDGSYTYMTPDIAYHKTKIDRGAQKLITLLGADHGGYVKRICSAVKAVSDNKAEMEIIIMQLVNLLDNGIPIKMSKRAGKFLTLRDGLDELGKDILRFIMLMRKGDTVLDLDFTQAKEQSKDNPAFYVQYAHTRIASLLRKALAQGIITEEEIHIKELDQERKLVQYHYDPKIRICYELLSLKHEINLIKQLALYPKVIEAAATSYEPHRLAYYLQDLAASLHGIWNLGVNNEELRFVITHNVALSRARIALVYGVAKTIGICLKIMGITPMLEM